MFTSVCQLTETIFGLTAGIFEDSVTILGFSFGVKLLSKSGKAVICLGDTHKVCPFKSFFYHVIISCKIKVDYSPIVMVDVLLQ